MKYRVGLLYKDKKTKGKNFDSVKESEEWILKQVEKDNTIKKAIIVKKSNIHDKQIINFD